MISKLRTTVMSMALFFGMSCTSFAAVNVPLIVKEGLPASVTGMNRTAEIVTGGIPLPEDSGITSISQLGLNGASAGQFRILGRWPNGNIKWVLLDFPVSLNAGTSNTSVTLTDGATGNFGGSNLAVDNGATITVSTGAATFTVKKANFNIFDTVTVGSTQLVNSGNSGRLHLIGSDSVEYSSSNDADSTAVIEENGPVRTVIKATGAFKSAGGTRFMDYTLRLHFYKGKTTVKGYIEMRHASKTNAYKTKNFTSIEALVPVSLGATKTVSFGKDGSTLTNSLPSAATAYLMQGYTPVRDTLGNVVMEASAVQNTIPGVAGADGIFHYDTSYMGLKIVVGSTNINKFRSDLTWGTSTSWATNFNAMIAALGNVNRSDGIGSIQDSSGAGVTLAYRNLSEWWPAGFEFKDNGDSSIELYSKYNGAVTLKLGFGQHDSREVMWDFHTSNGDDQSVHYALDYPLQVRAPFSQYTQSKALYGQSEFVTETEQAGVFSTLNRSVAPVPTTSPALTNPATTVVYKGWPWAVGGGWNQNNHVGDDLLDYLRTGRGGFFLRAETRTQMISDSALGRSDDYTTEAFSIADPDNVLYPKLVRSGSADGEHTYLYGLPLYYYMSGNEAIKEAWLDYGDRLLRNNITGYYQLPASQWLRALANTIRNSTIVYEFSCEQGACNDSLKTALEGAAAYQIDSRDKSVYGISGRGRNLDRGYLYWDVDVPYYTLNKRVTHSIYHNHIHFEAMYQLWRVMGNSTWNYSRRQELEDYLTGLAKFYLEEWLETLPTYSAMGKPPYNWKYGQHYDLLLDEVQPTTHDDIVPYSFGRAAIWAYQRTGDATYIDKGANMVIEQPAYSGDSIRNPSELQDQAMMWTYLNQASIPIWQPLTVNVTENGGGSYTLSWTVPAGAKQYQIKYSSKPIVEWLGFNKVTRTYQFDPASYAAFFAANNVVSNPAPSADGTVQSITLTGLPVGQKFAVKYLSSPLPTLSVPKAPAPPMALLRIL